MSSWAHRACVLHLWLRGSRCCARRPNDSCAVLADENTRFIVRIAMRPMALGLVESCIVVSVFQFGLRLEMGEAPVAVAHGPLRNPHAATRAVPLSLFNHVEHARFNHLSQHDAGVFERVVVFEHLPLAMDFPTGFHALISSMVQGSWPQA